MISRIIKPSIERASKSILLLGPRQVGKSTLFSQLKLDVSINLADEVEFFNLSSRPGELARLIDISKAKTVFIDEVQKLPRLLNTVQALIDKDKQLKFYLTGSSARKLKRGEANLLPGRVINFKMGPLVSAELNYQMDTTKVLSRGSLPEIFLGEDELQAQQILNSYVANYIKEEIKAEALTRNLDSFSRFLAEAILHVSQFIDYSKIANRAKVSRHAVPRYFEILEDTLLGYRIWPFKELEEDLDLIKHPKFFLFDVGVYNSYLKNYIASLDRIGVLSEQMIFSQIYHSAWAHNKDFEVSSFRMRKGVEVDFVLNLQNHIFAIEVKSNENISSEDLESLMFFNKAYPKNKGLFVFHLGLKEKKLGPIWLLPWQKGLQELGL